MARVDAADFVAETAVEILSVGMVTPVGASAAQTAASLRAGIGRLGESYVSDRFGKPMVMGLVDLEQLPPLVEALEDREIPIRHERLARLGGVALRETLASAPHDPLPLLLGIAEPRAQARSAIGEEMIEILATQSGLRFDEGCSRVYPLGRAAGLVALGDGLDLLARGRAGAVLVGAVDSYLDMPLLEALDGEGRLRTGEVSDGFVPGEGAAFLLLTRASPDVSLGRRHGGLPLARVAGVGRAREAGHLYATEPHRGDGLAAAFRAVLDAGARGPARAAVTSIYAGLNGESYWGKEWAVAQIRNADRLADPVRIAHPADAMGDAGAALGPVMLGLAALDLARGRDAGPVLVWAASDHGERAAALLFR
jgi:3-oxoacyl-[acyl-carrier-protein] synthase-1